jgi:uncharacterized protein (DUF952 family)
LLYHLALLSDWETAQRNGEYRVSTLGTTLDQQGFIHASFPHQVLGVAEHAYAGVTEPLVLLHIEEERLTAPWRVDPVPGDAQGFPHVYGPIVPAAVTRVTPVRRDPESGAWEGLPPALS